MSLKQLRKLSGMSQAVLANKAGVAQSTISGYESGKRTPRIHEVIKLSNALEVSTDELIKSLNIAEREVSTTNGSSGRED